MKILVIGETCLDVFVKCKVERLCPEAPVPLLNPISSTENYGMAGNVVANLNSLGGKDVFVNSITPASTIIKTRYIDSQTGYIITRIDEQDFIPESSSFWKLYPDSYLSEYITSDWDAVVISDYNKGFLSGLDIMRIAKICDGKGIPTFLDTKKILGSWSSDISFVKINEKEYKQQCSTSPCPEDLCRAMIVTLGDKGSKWVNADILVPVKPISVSDVSGAGDTYIAAFVIKYLSERKVKVKSIIDSIKSAMQYANNAARIAVSKRGVVVVKPEEIEL
jgi:bifunctional ADP-heptose synthase (sugar kinase/adenylyltransferase)